MNQVRIKHLDPSARISSTTTQIPDEGGGFIIEHEKLAQARAHGWFVAHAEHESGAELESAEDDAQEADENPVLVATDGDSEPAPGAELESAEDDAQEADENPVLVATDGDSEPAPGASAEKKPASAGGRLKRKE